MKKEETTQNYLEAIYVISLEKQEVRAIDIANYLNFSRPTVSVALKEMEKDNYISIENNSIVLTPKGKKVAEDIYERHEFIAKMLIGIGVNEEQAYIDSCLIEHDLSEESFNAIKKHYKK